MTKRFICQNLPYRHGFREKCIQTHPCAGFGAELSCLVY
jgi:hypothetical protein